jgi:hypothetical protein
MVGNFCDKKQNKNNCSSRSDLSVSSESGFKDRFVEKKKVKQDANEDFLVKN